MIIVIHMQMKLELVDEGNILLEEHLQKQGSLNIRCLKGFFIGPAGDRKTSIKKHLIWRNLIPLQQA